MIQMRIKCYNFFTFYFHPFLSSQDLEGTKAADVEGAVSESTDDAMRRIPEESASETHPEEVGTEDDNMSVQMTALNYDIVATVIKKTIFTEGSGL